MSSNTTTSTHHNHHHHHNDTQLNTWFCTLHRLNYVFFVFQTRINYYYYFTTVFVENTVEIAKFLFNDILTECFSFFALTPLPKYRRTLSMWASCVCSVRRVSSNCCDRVTPSEFYSGPLCNHSKHCHMFVCLLRCCSSSTPSSACR